MITIQDVHEHIRVSEELNRLCEKWAEKNLADWQRYSGAYVVPNTNTVSITYAYDDYHSNTDMCTEYDDTFVDLEEILKLQE